jgi:hypothetical protein
MNKEKIRLQCDALLLSMLGNEALCESWWKGSNKGFDGKTPEEVFHNNPNQVISYLMRFYDAGGS